MQSIHEALHLYDSLGLDTLPLSPGRKQAVLRGWDRQDSMQMWAKAPDGANIGIRAGGVAGVAILDCDDKNHPGTFQTISDYLAGLGVQDYPLVQTASGVGRHIYVRLEGDLDGHARILKWEIGAGEFRYGPGAYVVAPPSLLGDGGAYSLLGGSFYSLPVVDQRDILPLLGDVRQQATRRGIPRNTRALLEGNIPEKYNTRSQAEQAILVGLVNAGFDFPNVLALFNKYPCAGKYSELRQANPKKAEAWLRMSYDEARVFAERESPTRQSIQRVIAWVNSRPWPGRTGAIDQAILLAHLSIAFRAGRLEWAASCRELAERAGVTFKTAINSNTRLLNGQFLTIKKPSVATCATVYGLPAAELTHSLTPLPVRKCISFAGHDLFRRAGLGATARQLFEALQAGPLTINQLVEQTGRQRRTIKAHLVKMARLVDSHTGELLPMVSSADGETWHAHEIDLEKLALVVGVAGLGKKQRDRHAKERRDHRRSLARGQVEQHE